MSEISLLFCLESTTDGKLTVLKILESYTQQVGHTIPSLSKLSLSWFIMNHSE